MPQFREASVPEHPAQLGDLVIGPGGVMYVGGIYPDQSNELFRGDFSTMAFRSIQHLGFGRAYAIAFTPDGARAFVSEDSLHRVEVLDVAADSVVGYIVPEPLGEANGLAVTPDGAHLLMGTSDGNFWVYDANTYALIDSIPGLAAQFFAFRPGTGSVFLASGSSIRELDLTTFTVIRTIGSGAFWQLVLSPDGSRLYAGADGYGLRVFDVATGTEVGSVALGAGTGVALIPSKKLLYVTTGVAGRLAVIDAPTLTVLEQIQQIGGSRSITVGPDSATALLTWGNSSVRVVK